jgi:hypothetical protein
LISGRSHGSWPCLVRRRGVLRIRPRRELCRSREPG